VSVRYAKFCILTYNILRIITKLCCSCGLGPLGTRPTTTSNVCMYQCVTIKYCPELNKVCLMCWDNFDIMEETPSRSGTTHTTYGIMIQEIDQSIQNQ